jgi:hypothetical protein
VPAPTTLTARLEEAFASRLRDLPAVTCAALLVPALDSRVTLEEIARCVRSLRNMSVSVGVLEPAVDAALIDVVEGEVRFRHPLIRSAVRQAAGPGQVQATYAALAIVVDNPERRLWHRAMAAEGPDEEIAAALEDHARTARRRGAVTVAGAALERAAALTADTHRKSARVVAAAEVAYELGLAAAVRRLIQQAETLDLDPMHSARLAWLRQMMTGNVWYESGATRTFVTIAKQMQSGGGPDMALRSLVPIAHRCWWTQNPDRDAPVSRDAARSMGIADDDPRVLAVIALADPENTEHRCASAWLTCTCTIGRRGRAHGCWNRRRKSWRFRNWRTFSARAVADLREQVRLGPLTRLVHLAGDDAHGEWDVAAAARLREPPGARYPPTAIRAHG